MDIKQLTFQERIVVQRYITDLWEYLMRQREYFQDTLRKKPGDIVAMSGSNKIDMDLQTIEPLVKDLQRTTLLELEVILGKPFHFLIDNKPKDLLKKAK